jgi:hypothetical protein
MNSVRQYLEIITERFVSEHQRRENFVFPSEMTPGPAQYAMVAPIFGPYGIAPQDAVTVLLNFDKDPADLSPKDLQSRIGVLNVLNTVLNDQTMVNAMLADSLSANQSADQKANVEATLALTRRMISLLILESSYASDSTDADDIAENFADPMMTTAAPMMTTAAPMMTTGPRKKSSADKLVSKIKSGGEKLKSVKAAATMSNVVILVLLIATCVLSYLLYKKK